MKMLRGLSLLVLALVVGSCGGGSSQYGSSEVQGLGRNYVQTSAAASIDTVDYPEGGEATAADTAFCGSMLPGRFSLTVGDYIGNYSMWGIEEGSSYRATLTPLSDGFDKFTSLKGHISYHPAPDEDCGEFGAVLGIRICKMPDDAEPEISSNVFLRGCSQMSGEDEVICYHRRTCGMPADSNFLYFACNFAVRTDLVCDYTILKE